MEPLEPSATEITRYLDLLYASAPGEAQLVVSWPDPHPPRKKPRMLSAWKPIGERGSVITPVADWSRTKNVYVNIGLRHPSCQGTKYIRGKDADVWVLPGLWADLDHAGGVHAATDLPSRDELWQFLRHLPFRWSLIVDSGGGFHAYVLFREAWVLETAAERRLAQALLRDFQFTLQAMCAQHGWSMDNTSDLTRVLRPAGTLNHKNGAVRRVSLWHEDSVRYNPTDIDSAAWLITAPDARPQPDTSDTWLAKIAPMVEGCAWLRHCRDDAATLPEPQWYAMLSLLDRCEDGVSLAHEWSQAYPGYSRQETDQKLLHARDKPPRLCRNIALLTASAYCQTCPSWERINSPMKLGYPRAPEAEEEEKAPPPAEDRVLPFPVESLPQPLARLVKEAAAALPAPPEFVAVPMLSVLGAAIGDTRVLEVKPGWSEGAYIWSAVVAEPGTKKSPALDIARQPLDSLQASFKNAYEDKVKDYEKEMVKYEIALAAWARKVKDGTATAASKPALPDRPVMPRIYSTDATIEAFCALLEANPKGLLFIRDELTGWALSMNQYKGGKGADRQAWLSFFNGSPVALDRKNLAGPLLLMHPFVCVTGCLPTDVLGDLSDERGREDGFIHRILFAMPDYVAPIWSEATISTKARADYAEVVHALRKHEQVQINGKGAYPQTLTFTAEAKDRFVRLSNQLHAEMAGIDFPVGLRGPWSKLEGYGARLALVIHLARSACKDTSSHEVDEDSMVAASDLIDYFASQARRVYSRLHATKDDTRVLGAVEWIKAHGNRVTARELLTTHVAGVKTKTEAIALFKTLEDRGYGTTKDGPKKSVIFTLVGPR
jgi:Protein of unknown function (DUF3987)